MPCTAGQIIGVNVVGKYVVLAAQYRIPAPDALHRQTFGGVDAVYAQDAHSRTTALAPATQLPFGVDTSLRPEGGRSGTACLADPGSAAIAIDAAGADVNQAAW